MEFESRLRAIPWGSYVTADGAASDVPRWLWDLRYGESATAEEAAWRLADALCHQKGQLASAAEPALPFLIETLSSAPTKLQVEIFDVLHGFALCSDPRRGYPPDGYHRRVRDQLHSFLPAILPFATNPSADIQAFVQGIADELHRPELGESAEPSGEAND